MNEKSIKELLNFCIINVDKPSEITSFVCSDRIRRILEAKKAGHGGGDYFEVKDWVDAILGIKPCPIGIHEAMDMTLPGLVSQQSILQGGEWLDVPDSRDW